MIKRILLIVALMFCHYAMADDWGCQVLLCLSNPAGPTAVAECGPPIAQLLNTLRHGGSFPSCGLASGGGGNSYAVISGNPYPMCPSGTTPLAQGVNVAQLGDSSTLYQGIGDGSSVTTSGDSGMPSLVCVGGQATNMTVSVSDGYGDVNQVTVPGYPTVKVLQPQGGLDIDVVINGQLSRRVNF